MDIWARQQATYQALIKRFGPEVGLSQELYQKVANGKASAAENIEYQKKADSLTERVQKFYRETDVAKVDKMSDSDIDVLIAMLNTGFAVTQNQTTHITKVMNNSTMEKSLKAATSEKSVFVGGFIGSAEATEALSPQQQVTTLGLDYETETGGIIKRDFLLNVGTKDKPKYEPIPQTCYMKMPYTEELKKETLMTLDVRLYEKITERAKTAGEPIATMAREISERNLCLKYRSDNTESKEENEKKCKEFTEKYKTTVKSADPPFTGLGFSSYGEKIGSGFMNMYPEMNIKANINENSYHKYVGSGEVEFYAKFAKTDKDLDTYNPQGSVDVLVGKWNGKKVDIPDQAKEEYTINFIRVKAKFSKDNQKTLGDNANQSLLNKSVVDFISLLDKQRLSLDRVEMKVAGEDAKKDKLPKALKDKFKEAGHLILSKNKKLSDKSREALAEEHEKKHKEEEEKKMNNREKVSLSGEQHKKKTKRKKQETGKKSSQTSE